MLVREETYVAKANKVKILNDIHSEIQHIINLVAWQNERIERLENIVPALVGHTLPVDSVKTFNKKIKGDMTRWGYKLGGKK